MNREKDNTLIKSNNLKVSKALNSLIGINPLVFGGDEMMLLDLEGH